MSEREGKTTNWVGRSYWLVAVGTLCAALGGCAADADLGEVADETEMDTSELAYPGEGGPTGTANVEINGQMERLEYEAIHGDMVFEGDIILGHLAEGSDTPDQASVEEIAAGPRSWLWPNRTVYYTIDPNLPNPSRVTAAISHWNTYTNLRLVRRTTQRGYVTFTTGSGCSADIGYRGRQQFVRLARNCSTGTVIHEIGHTVGLWHEQSRTDRGNHIRIHWTNIQSGKESNFRTYTQLGFSGSNIGPYETRSIMHYGSYAFSRNGRPTITTLSGATFSAQRSGLSRNDRAGINRLYPL